MDSVKIRELEEKTTLNPTDTIVIEDYDGTKVVSVSNLQSSLQKVLFYNTIEDLKNAELNEGDVVRTLGYHTLNDGGGATYIIVYAPTDIDNGATVIYLNTSDTLRAHIIASGPITPLQCGAYGDGVHNDYSILNKIFKLGLDIEFTRNNYYIGENSFLKIQSNTKVDFNGATISGSGGIQLGLDEKSSDITISNLIIDTGSVRLDKLASNIYIDNCRFINNTLAIDINGATSTYISNCIIGKDTRVTNGIRAYNAIGLFISNCIIYFNGTGIYSSIHYSSQEEYLSAKAHHTSITNCQLQGPLDPTNNSDNSSVGIELGSISKIANIASCTFENINTAIVVQYATIQLSISDINAIMVRTLFKGNGYDTSVVYLSGNIELRYKKSFVGYLPTIFGPGNIGIYNNAIFTIAFNTSENVNLTTGLTGNNRNYFVISPESIIDEPLEYKGELISQVLDLDNLNLPMTKKPLFNAMIRVNSIGSSEYAKMMKGINHGYNGQVLTLYSDNGVKLIVNDPAKRGNIKHSSLDVGYEIQLHKYVPVKVKYNGSYWDIIDYEEVVR